MTGLICIVGIVVALMHRKQAERPALIVTVSLGVLLALSVMGVLVEQLAYGMLASQRGGGGAISGILRIWGWFSNLGQAVALAGLTVASLIDRGFDVLSLPSKK